MATPTIAANAYAALSRMRDDTANIAGGLGKAQDAGPNFGSILKDVMDAVSATAHNSDLQAQAVAAGKANMVDVVTAVADTETAFQTLVSVRDKVIAAYEDVLKMPI
ncbi:MAG: flagellar hook-basal body complex protein FliE [Xanthobacteraceae bacterium]|jgi:flagellar hook-basal body complex protein FliE